MTRLYRLYSKLRVGSTALLGLCCCMPGSKYYLADGGPPLKRHIVRGIWQLSLGSSKGIKLRKYVEEDTSNHARITNRRIDESGALHQSIANSATWFIAVQTIQFAGINR
jgi:hypothetical protein